MIGTPFTRFCVIKHNEWNNQSMWIITHMQSTDMPINDKDSTDRRINRLYWVHHHNQSSSSLQAVLHPVISFGNQMNQKFN